MSRRILCIAAALVLSFGRPVLGAPPEAPLAWVEVDRLVSEHKLKEAAERLDALLPVLRASGDQEAWMLALVRGSQLRVTTSRHEEAVRFLQSQPWPQGRRQRAILSLFYAEALKNYYVHYRWRMWTKEAVRSDKPVDVEQWTTGQIFEAASKAYLDAWKEREALEEISVAELSGLVQPNSYPSQVRGTLRDTVTYLWATLLADTAFWSPAQSNAAERLELVALFRDSSPESSEERLADPEVHPLVRMVSILADLERWHDSRGNGDGALEARLERARHLKDHTSENEGKALREELEAYLPAFRETSWWAMGMAELAELYRKTGDLAGAVRIAHAGHEAFPKSAGGERSLDIARGIEAPAFDMTSMASDGLSRRSLQVRHKNLPVLWLRAYEVDLEQRLSLPWQSGQGGQPPWPRLEEDLLPSRPAFAWKVELPATPDHQVHTTYFTPEIDRPGAYVVVASGREDFATRKDRERLPNKLVATPLILGDLVLVARESLRSGVEVVAVSGSSGEPVAGVEVGLYDFSRRRDRRPTVWRTTREDGAAAFQLKPRENHAFFARKGEDVALVQDAIRWDKQEEETGRASLLFTDRSVYRPQQKLFWKVLVYENRGEGRFRGIAGASTTVSLLDPNGQVVESRSVATNGFGTASGEFTIPPGRPLGFWSLSTSQDDYAAIRVEEYKRPTFEVTLTDPEEPLKLNRPASFPGEARYYFGLPVTRGEVRWRAVRETRSLWALWIATGNEETVATGTAELSRDGTFEVAFTPEAGDLKGRDPRQVTHFYRIEADLTDEGGETRSAQRSFRLGWTSIEADIRFDRDLYVAGQPGIATIQRRDLAGIGRPGEGTWTLHSLRQPAETPLPADLPPQEDEDEGFRTEGDRLRPRFEPEYDPEEALRLLEDGAQVASGTLRHDEDGEAELPLPALSPGAYRLRYETVDESGETFSTWRELIVAGDQTPLALPAILVVDDSEARPGGTIRVLAHSGFPDQVVWLEVWQSQRVIRRRQLRMDSSASLIEIPIGKEDRGGFSLRLVGVRDHQLLEVEKTVAVPWDDRRLEIEVATFRDRIRPGSRETWTVKVRPAEGAEGEGAAAELLAYLYDRSLDLFAPHEPANPLDLYPDHTGRLGWSDSSLGTFRTYASGSGWEHYSGPALRRDELHLRLVLGAVERETADGMEIIVPAPPSPLLEGRSFSTGYTVRGARDPWAILQATPGVLVDRITVGGNESGPAALTPVELRSDFSETAFWQPHLIAGPDGIAAIEFEVPDSVTAWSFWVHAVTRDLRAGSLQKEVRSVKDLMVRPYAPRFLRESDRALVEVVLNNASEGDLQGTVTFDILDPGTEKSLLADFGLDPLNARAPFTVAARSGASVTFPLTAPKRVGPVAFKVTAVAGTLSDGELRPLPILPSRMHLAQSRFAALKEPGRKELRFEDMSKDDPTRIDEQLVLTIDGQLFYSVLESVPYLVDYPYDCTEQTLNRFLSTGILARVSDKYPAVAAMARGLSKREAQFETWDTIDPNRKMALEETPWLEVSQGGKDPGRSLIKVLDPRVARAQRDQALDKLKQAQLADGGFPWWPGGEASPYMTLYLLYGFAKASEFGIEVPSGLVESGWKYVANWFREDRKEKTCCRELQVLMNYVASAYPDSLETLTAEERRQVLDDSFAHWKELSGYLKVLLALTLNRMDRPDDAQLVFDAVMDLSKTTAEDGTFWAPEKQAWLWYQDTIETHAFALLAMTEIRPDDPRRHGLVQWLFLNKQLNHWHSTRATAEVIYALVHYLEAEGQLGAREKVTVRVANQAMTFTFEPDRYTGKHNQVVVPGEKLGPQAATVVVDKESPALMFASATWHFSTDQLPTEARGDLFGVTRRYFLRSGAGKEVVLTPLEEGIVLKPGDEVEVHLAIASRSPAEYVHLRDPRPAGLEPDGARSGYKWDWTSPGRYEETRDSGTNFFFDWLPAGEYTLKYRLRANMAGTFRVGPATLQSMYAPEFTAYSAVDVMTVEGLR